MIVYMKQKRKLRKDRVISTVIPLVIIIILGGIIGNKMTHKEDKKENVTSNINQVTNQEQSNSVNDLNQINSKNETIEENNDIHEEKKEENNDIEEGKSEETTPNRGTNVKFDETVAFIGDSRTQGFIMYNGLKDVQDYSYVGLMVDTAVSKKFVKTSNGEKITLLEDMKGKNIKRVYIMLGVNELGWSYPQVFKSKYKELIKEIKKIKPNAQIYVQSIIPVTKSRDKSDKYFNNTRIEQYNKLVKEVASEENVEYLNVQSALVNSESYLPEETSPDGIHIGKSYCEKWLEYLKNNS